MNRKSCFKETQLYTNPIVTLTRMDEVTVGLGLEFNPHENSEFEFILVLQNHTKPYFFTLPNSECYVFTFQDSSDIAQGQLVWCLRSLLLFCNMNLNRQEKLRFLIFCMRQQDVSQEKSRISRTLQTRIGYNHCFSQMYFSQSKAS